MERARKLAPYIDKFYKYAKYIIILSVLGFLIYSSSSKFGSINKTLNKEYASSGEDDTWDDEEAASSLKWVPGYISTVIEGNFSLIALKEMSYYIGLTVFALVGFGVLSHYNHKHDLKVREIELKMIEEEKQKLKQMQKEAREKEAKEKEMKEKD